MTEAGWTREKPTAAGWYWWRRDNTKKPRCVRVREFGGRLVVWDIPDDMEKAFDDMKPCGEWLGPVTPDSYQQGRVASCEWKYDDMNDYYKTACKNAYCVADGTLKDNDHKYCPYCGGLIQLAQDEKGLRDVLK